MHLLLPLVLLALVAGPFASAAQLKSGLYTFKTETVSNEGSPLSLTGSVVIFPQFSEKGNLYSLTVQELSLSSSVAPLPPFDLPFQFVRLDNGLVEYVNVHPSETLEMKNLKKSIVEALQTSLSPNPHSRSEAGAAGIRQTHYSSATKTDGVIMYSSHFDLSDFTSFAEFSGLEAGHVKLSGNKLVLVNEEDQSVLEGGATLKIVKGADIRVVSSTSIKFLSGDVAMIDMIQEGPFNRESLVHELNPTARLAELKARLPSLPTLISLLTSEELSTKDAIKARSQLVLLMNRDQEALNEGLAFLAQELEKSPNTKKTALVFSTLARVNAPEAQAFLAQELMKATEVPQLVIILKSLTALQNPAAPTILLKALSQIQTPKELHPLVELTIAHIAKFLDKEEAEDIVIPFLKRLQAATTDADKIHNLYILGNTGKNAPASEIAHFLEDLSLQVRVAAITSLRSHMHIPEIQEFLAAFLKKKENFRSEPVMNTLAGAMKGKIKMMELGGKLHRALSAIPSPNKEIQELLALLGPLPELSLGGSSSTDIWNNTSDPIFNLISPSSVRQQDVDRYPNYEGYLFGAQYGPDLANLKVATGVFSGHGDDGCLAGDFKIFDKLYTEVQLLDDVLVLADLYVYFLTYDNEFDSRLYGLVNGNVIIDIKISSNCSEDEYIIFSGEIQIIFWETEIPLDIGTAYIFLDAAAFLEFEAGYRICLLTGNPYLEIYTTGEIGFLAFAGAHVTAVGILRAGIDADVFFNYVIGPDTRLGSVNNTAGELVCAACIGVYYGYDDQSAYIGAFIQRRQGLGWGEKQEIPIAEWVEPSVPFPTALVETCAETEMTKASFSRAAAASDTPLFVPSQHTKPAGKDSFTLI